MGMEWSDMERETLASGILRNLSDVVSWRYKGANIAMRF